MSLPTVTIEILPDGTMSKGDAGMVLTLIVNPPLRMIRAAFATGLKCIECQKALTPGPTDTIEYRYDGSGHLDVKDWSFEGLDCELCPDCFEQAGLENEHQDGGHAQAANPDCRECRSIWCADCGARMDVKGLCPSCHPNSERDPSEHIEGGA